jgi:hypothetical protein
MTTRRKFLKTAGVAGAATLAAPAIVQGAGDHQVAHADLCRRRAGRACDQAGHRLFSTRSPTARWRSSCSTPTRSCPRASCSRPCSAAPSTRCSRMTTRWHRPPRCASFGGYFPFATRTSLDVPVLFNQYGLAEIWARNTAKVGVKHISAGARTRATSTPRRIKSLADLEGKRVYTFPTAGRFLAQFGVVPVNMPYEDIEVAVQTGELDGMAWSGITEDYTVGWADVTDYFLTNNISGAWIGSFFANMERWAELPDHLKELLMAGMEAGHTYRNQWYWGGEAAPARQRRQAGADAPCRPRVGKVETRPRSSGTRSRPRARPRRRSSASSASTTRSSTRPGGPTRYG